MKDLQKEIIEIAVHALNNIVGLREGFEEDLKDSIELANDALEEIEKLKSDVTN